MSYFIFKDNILTYSPYTVAPSGVMARNNSNIMISRFGLLFVLNDQGRTIVDWITGGDKNVSRPSSFVTDSGYGVLLDKAGNLRTVVLGSYDNEARCSVCLYQTGLMKNLVHTVDMSEREKIQFSLDAGYSVADTLKAMERFNPIYRDAISMTMDKAMNALVNIDNLVDFHNPNISLDKDK